MKRGFYFWVWMMAVLGAASVGVAQFGGSGFGGSGGGRRGGNAGRNQELGPGSLPNDPLPADRDGTPNWEVDSQFKSDVFTFVRLRYTSVAYGDTFPDGMRKTGGNWRTDFPGSDLHFPFRLRQMTSLKVDPEGKRIDITDDALFDYPMVYMLEVGRLEFSEEELGIMRRYLLNGGFLLVDDHWGISEQRNWREQLKRVFPEREPVELGIEHPIFHCVFDLKKLPQIPGLPNWKRFQTTGEPDRTWERTDDTQPHYRATFDDKGRIMVLECANTDLGDGWEEEGDNPEYFHKFSENQAYPMGINVIFWAMTH